MATLTFNFTEGRTTFRPPEMADMSVADVFAPIAANVTFVKDLGSGHVYIPATGVDAIGDMLAGAPYSVAMSAACSLTVTVIAATGAQWAWTTPEALGGERYCRLDAGALAQWTGDLQALIAGVTDQMIDYVGAGNIDPANPPPRLVRACEKQCAYEFNRRKDLGLGGVAFKDGNVSKWQIDEWLKDVKTAMDRCTCKKF